MKSAKISSIEIKSKGKTLKELNLGLKDFTADILDIATEDIVYVIPKEEYERLSKKFSVCTCIPMPNIDWCEKCTWDEVHRECAKNEALEKDIETQRRLLDYAYDYINPENTALIYNEEKSDWLSEVHKIKTEHLKKDAGALLKKDFKSEELLLQEIEELKQEIAELRAGMHP